MHDVLSLNNYNFVILLIYRIELEIKNRTDIARYFS